MSETYPEIRLVQAIFLDTENYIDDDTPVFMVKRKAQAYLDYGAGCLMPLCGAYAESDHLNPIMAAKRIGQEQAGMIGLLASAIAKVAITVTSPHKLRILIDVVLFPVWVGKRPPTSNQFFWSSRFIPLKDIQWDKAPTGYRDWFPQTLRCTDGPSSVEYEVRDGQVAGEIYISPVPALQPN